MDKKMNLNPIVLCENLKLWKPSSPSKKNMALLNLNSSGSNVKRKKTTQETVKASNNCEGDLSSGNNMNKQMSNGGTHETNRRRFYQQLSCGRSPSGKLEYMYLCLCNKYFTSKKGVMNHIRCHENLKSLQCENCPKMFLYEKHLKKHIIRVHSEPFKCEYCDKKFSRDFLCNYIRHKSTSHSFKCDQCNMSYVTKTRLMHHSKTHSVRRLFGCTLCPLTFSLKSHLNRHFMMHTRGDQRLFRCSMCRELFSGITALAAHYRLHVYSSGLKVQQSPTREDKIEKDLKQVEKQTKIIGNRKKSDKHQENREGKRGNKEVLFGRLSLGRKKASLHACYVCDKYFKTKFRLLQHMKMHTLIGRFTCKLCKRCYSTKGKLQDHRKMLHSCKCNKCDLKFAKKSHLKRHAASHVNQ